MTSCLTTPSSATSILVTREKCRGRRSALLHSKRDTDSHPTQEDGRAILGRHQIISRSSITKIEMTQRPQSTVWKAVAAALSNMTDAADLLMLQLMMSRPRITIGKL